MPSLMPSGVGTSAKLTVRYAEPRVRASALTSRKFWESWRLMWEERDSTCAYAAGRVTRASGRRIVARKVRRAAGHV